MPRNTTGGNQFALVYNDDFIHVVEIAPNQVIDTGLETLVIRNSEASLESHIAGLGGAAQTRAAAELENFRERERANGRR